MNSVSAQLCNQMTKSSVAVLSSKVVWQSHPDATTANRYMQITIFALSDLARTLLHLVIGLCLYLNCKIDHL